jgi:flagellar hook-associated protein 1 FlgK
MRSTFSGLNTVVRGVYAQQISLDTVGHNIANASTDGYSRQRANLSTTNPETVYGGVGSLQVGTGVAIESVTRARDIFIDRQYWKENSSLGYAQTSQTTWGKIEAIFNDDTTAGVGMQTVLNNFWQSWQTLVSNASNDSARTAVRQRAGELVDAIQHARQQLNNLVTDTNATLTTNVDSINEMSSEIYALNKQISNIEAGGKDNANDLRDKRDMLVDKLSSMMKVNVYEDSERNYTVAVGDVILADGGGFTKLGTYSTIDRDYDFEVRSVIVAGSNPLQKVKFGNGEMQALQEANSTLAQNYLDDLTTMSQYLLTEFNAVHRGGYGSDNSTNVNFFGDATVDYSLLNITKSDAASGDAKVLGIYTGAADATYRVRMDTVTAGKVTAASYSTDGGATWTSATVDNSVDPPIFTLNNGLSVQIDTNTNNTAITDYYTFGVTARSNRQWLDSIKVNPQLFNADGLSKIAAKTAEVKAITQSNTAGGAATVSGTYNPNYVPTTPTTIASPYTTKNYQVSVTTNAAHVVTGVTYSVTDSSGNILATGTGTAVAGGFDIGYGLVVGFAVDTDTNTGDTYSFSVPQGNASGDNATNLADAIKQPTVKSTSLLKGSSLDDYYESMVADLGIQSQNKSKLATNQQTMMNQITTWRESVAGVNLDEEMTNMIKFQKGYNAAARILTSIDEMLDKLINGTGVVGR